VWAKFILERELKRVNEQASVTNSRLIRAIKIDALAKERHLRQGSLMGAPDGQQQSLLAWRIVATTFLCSFSGWVEEVLLMLCCCYGSETLGQLMFLAALVRKCSGLLSRL
jgi:hypothetical protein